MNFFLLLALILGLAFFASLAMGAFIWWRFGSQIGRKQSVVDAMVKVSFVIDSQYNILHANAAAAALFEVEADQFIGKNILSFVRGEWPQAIITQTGEGEFTAVLGENSQFSYLAQISALAIVTNPANREYLVTLTQNKQQPASNTPVYPLGSEIAEQFVKLATKATREPDLKQTAPAILKTFLDATEAENGSLLIFNERQNVVHGIAMGYGRSKVRIMDEQTAVQAGKQEIVQAVLTSGQKLILSQVAKSEKWQHLHTERTPINSIFVVPICKEGMVSAVLMLTHAEENHFNGDHIQLYSSSNDLLSHVLYSSQKYEARVNQGLRQQTIDQVLRLVSTPSNPTSLAQETVKAIAERTGWIMVAILVPRPDKQLLTTMAVETRLHMQSSYDLPFDQSFSGRAYTSGTTQIISEELTGSGTIEQAPLMSLVCVPLKQGDEKKGVLTIGSDNPDAFTKEDVRLAELISETIAVAMANTEFHNQVNQYANNLNALFEATKRISRLLKIDEILDEALQTALRFTGFEAGLISLEDSDSRRLLLAHKAGMNRFAANLTAEIDLSTTVSGIVQQRAKYILLETTLFPSLTRKTIEKVQPDAMQLLRDMGYVAYAGAPLLYQNKALGTLCLFHSSEKTLTDEERSVHLALAQQTAAMVANARLVDAIESERKQLQTVIQSSREGIIMVDQQWQIRVFNEPAASLLQLGDPASQWIGRHLRSLAVAIPYDTKTLVNQIRESIRTPATNPHGTWHGSVSHNDMYLEWHSVPVESGQTTFGRLFVIYNVSESHQLQQLREELVYTMVHDLRNPIGIANMSAQYFRDRFYDDWEDDDREVLDGIESALDKSLKLITGILEISRLEDKSMPVQPGWVEAEFLLTQSLFKQDALARKKNIHLDIEMQEELPFVWADVDLIERVLQNLLDNAIKFTPENGSVILKTALDEEQNRLLISVKDNGAGIPEEIDLFQKFSKGGQEERGSGLGLAFCKMALEAHGQSIWVSDTSPAGTTITFTLAIQTSDSELELYIVEDA